MSSTGAGSNCSARRAERVAGAGRGRRLRLPRGDQRGPRGRRAGESRRAAPRPRRPPRGDHRPDRSEDDDQRPELRGEGMACRPRGCEHAALGERDRRPAEPPRRHRPAPSTSRATRASVYRLTDGELATIVVRPRGWHLPEKHILVDGEEIVRLARRLRALPGHQRHRRRSTAAKARTTTCRRWSATSRPGSGTTSSSAPRSLSASRAAPSARPCSSRPTRPHSRWRRSSTSSASTPPASMPAAGTTCSASSSASAPAGRTSCCPTATR